MNINYISLDEFVSYAEKLSRWKESEDGKRFGEYSIVSIGCSCGVINGLKNPFAVYLKDIKTGNEKVFYLPSMVLSDY